MGKLKIYMGCDIHEMIEKKHYWSDGTPSAFSWTNCGEAELDRNYWMFSILAGVRNGMEIKPISLPRGLPNDVSEQFKEWHRSFGANAHSASWVTLKEMKEYQLPQPFKEDEVFLKEWQELINRMELHKTNNRTDDEVRLVFFFDN